MSQQSNNTNTPPPSPQKKSPSIWTFLLIALVITILFNTFFGNSAGSGNKLYTSYDQFLDLVERGVVQEVVLQDNQIIYGLKDNASLNIVNNVLGEDKIDNVENKQFYTGKVDNPALTQTLLEKNITFSATTTTTTDSTFSFFTNYIFFMVIIYLIYFLIIRFVSKRISKNMSNSPGGSGGFGGFGNLGNMMGGKSNVKEYNMEKNTGITFKDVAGQDEAKESLLEMVDYLNNPDRYKKIGAKQPKGALLVGPPGTGKTLLAKAVAGEAGVPFLSITGSEFVEMFVGMGAKRVRELFQQAKSVAPCIIFIDEIDAIGKKRDMTLGSNDEREQTLNQLLAEMDGFEGRESILVLAATNRPEVLDQALLRPGRFDRRIIVEKPDLIGREAILRVHSDKVKLDKSVNLHAIALMTSGATGADLANMINEAALHAVKHKRDKVLQSDLEESVEVVIAGKEKKDRIMNTKERRMVAYHEVGHALASAVQKNSQPVQKITIVPRTMGSLGYTMQMPEEERYLLTQSELKAQIVTLLAGRAAEEITFGEASTGASNDIEQATKIARSMITQYGMSAHFDMVNLENPSAQYLDGRPVPNYAEGTGVLIDEEVQKIIKECHKEAAEIIRKKQAKLIEIAEYLLEKETISGDEFMTMLNA